MTKGFKNNFSFFVSYKKYQNPLKTCVIVTSRTGCSILVECWSISASTHPPIWGRQTQGRTTTILETTHTSVGNCKDQSFQWDICWGFFWHRTRGSSEFKVKPKRKYMLTLKKLTKQGNNRSKINKIPHLVIGFGEKSPGDSETRTFQSDKRSSALYTQCTKSACTY